MTKPTRKRYTFAPVCRSTLKRLFKQFSGRTINQIYSIFFTGKQKIIFRVTSRRSPKKRVKFILRAYFRRASRLCFFATFIMKFRQSLTPHNLCIPSLLSIHMVIGYLWCLSEANQSQMTAERVGSIFYCFSQTGLKFQLSKTRQKNENTIFISVPSTGA